MGNGGEKVSWKRVLILAGAVIAFTISSGFATGQEIIEYYAAVLEYKVFACHPCILRLRSCCITSILQKQVQSRSLKEETMSINISVENTSVPSAIIIPHCSVTCPSS